jgi:hypothetical protein
VSTKGNHSQLPSTFRIAERIRNGEKPKDMAKQYGVSTETLCRHLRAAGWDVATGTAKPAEDGRGPFRPASEQKLVEGPPLRIPAFADLPCRQDPDAWFPEKGGGSLRTIKAMCTGCPIREACLEFAIVHDDIQHGVWGGFAFEEIARMRSKRKAAA